MDVNNQVYEYNWRKQDVRYETYYTSENDWYGH